MTLKIEKYSDGHFTTIRLIGRMQAEHLEELEKELRESGPAITLDLEELTLVDVESVRFLGSCEVRGATLLSCSPYRRDWIGEEREPEDMRLKVDTIPGLVGSTRPDGSAEFFNQLWLEYTGLSAEQALDWGWKVAIHPDDLPRILDTFHEALSLQRSFEVEGRFLAGTDNFAGFSFAAILCWTDREKLSNGTERIPISKSESERRTPSAIANRVSV